MSHILLVEDDLKFREPLVQVLTNDGHTVSVAGDGTAALLSLKTDIRPDLIITDILMPNMDGIELIAELSRLHNAVPIIAMSGGRRSITSEFNLSSAAVIGVKVTLAKPFSRADLRRAIHDSLASRI